MPRGPRLDSPGLLHHVRLRGVERRDIFSDDLDREAFCGRLEAICTDGGAEILAWCLMSNHVHLAIRCELLPLAGVMRRLLTGYAMHYNKRHVRVGHLFQNRYKSTVVDSERYMLSLVRYIHLNPVEAGVLSSLSTLEQYAWCGYGALMGQGARTFQNTREVLARFGSSAEEARAELRLFMGDTGAAQSEASTFEGGGLKRSVGGRAALRRLQEDVQQGKVERELHDARVLGRGAMVESLLKQEQERRQQSRLNPEARAAALVHLLEKVSLQSGLSVTELRGAGRRKPVVDWRRVIAYLGMSRLGASATEMATLLGLTLPTVLVGVAQGPELLRKLSVDVETLS